MFGFGAANSGYQPPVDAFFETPAILSGSHLRKYINQKEEITYVRRGSHCDECVMQKICLGTLCSIDLFGGVAKWSVRFYKKAYEAQDPRNDSSDNEDESNSEKSPVAQNQQD